MKIFHVASGLTAVAAIALLAGCAHTNQSPDVSSNIRKALEQAGLKTVSVADDTVHGVVTLSGQVISVGNKTQADTIATSIAGGQVVADQIAVIPKGQAGKVKAIEADVDKGISENLDAAMIQNNLKDQVRFSVKNQVVTLQGSVDSEAERQQAQQVAAAVPNVQQVVNELQLKYQKATSSSE